MAIGISPTVDFAFKLVFGNPDHTGITIHFLNSILNLPSPITEVTIQNPYLDSESISGKGGRDGQILDPGHPRGRPVWPDV